jgi:hypothetical protein
MKPDGGRNSEGRVAATTTVAGSKAHLLIRFTQGGSSGVDIAGIDRAAWKCHLAGMRTQG